MGKKFRLNSIEDFQKNKSNKELVLIKDACENLTLGQDNTGLIIYGTKNSGVSNTVHVILASLLESYTDRELELSVIDLEKGNELQPYELARAQHLKHLVKEGDLTILTKLINEMTNLVTRRNELIIKAECINFEDYREKEELPRVVFFIKGLQEVSNQHDNNALCRVVQSLKTLVKLGRAVGVHLVITCSEVYNQDLQDMLPNVIVLKSSLSMSNKTLGASTAENIRAGNYFAKNNGTAFDGIKRKIPLIEHNTIVSNCLRCSCK